MGNSHVTIKNRDNIVGFKHQNVEFNEMIIIWNAQETSFGRINNNREFNEVVTAWKHRKYADIWVYIGHATTHVPVVILRTPFGFPTY